MTSAGIRDLGDILLRVAATFLGGVLLALAFDVDPGRMATWGWLLAVVGCPVAYGVRAYGLRQMQLDEESAGA